VKLKRSGIFSAIALVVCLYLQLVASAFAQDGGTRRTWSNRQITIRIHDYAQIKSGALFQAEQSAADILKEAGIDANWVECQVGETSSRDAACARPMTPLDVVLNLLPRSMAKRSDLREEVFGAAVEGTEKDFGFFASVFYDKVKDCAVLERMDLAPFLGAVMAHELGHLLLGKHSHANEGLMRPGWSRKQLHIAEQRGLVFTPSEARQIQDAVVTRSLATSRETGNSNEHPFLLSSSYLIEIEGRIGSQNRH
jgi:hypothetical protein